MVLRCTLMLIMTVTKRIHVMHLVNVEHRRAFANIYMYIHHLVLLGPKAAAHSSVSRRFRRLCYGKPATCVIAA